MQQEWYQQYAEHNFVGLRIVPCNITLNLQKTVVYGCLPTLLWKNKKQKAKI